MLPSHCGSVRDLCVRQLPLAVKQNRTKQNTPKRGGRQPGGREIALESWRPEFGSIVPHKSHAGLAASLRSSAEVGDSLRPGS